MNYLKYLMIILLISGTFGCSSLSLFPQISGLKPIKGPQSNQISKNIKKLKTESVKNIEILEIPAKPKANKIIDAEGTAHVGFDKEGLNALRQLRQTAKTNTAIAKELQGAAVEFIEGRNAVLDLALTEEERANYISTKWGEAETDLNREKVGRALESLGYKSVILGLVLIILGLL